MNRFAFWLSLSVVTFVVPLISCEEEELSPDTCGTPATVRNLTGMDGCGYVFELENGTRLLAIWEWGWCGTPPLPEGATEDPIYNFEYVDGKSVMISYEKRPDYATACMASEPVKITCLREFEIVTHE